MEEFNEDEKEAPTWLNKEYFEMVLRTYEKDDTIAIIELNITPGSAKGDHLASIIFRVVAEYSSKASKKNSRSMIVKTVPEGEGFKKELLEQSRVFENEIRMYSETVPKLEDVLRKHGDSTQLCAKILYHSIEPRKVVIFEDLVALGYGCLRDRYVNVEEVKACLSKLAKWHAASFKLASEGDESIQTYEDGLLSRPKEEIPLFLSNGLQLFINAIAKIDGLAIYAQKLQALEATLIPKCNEIFKAHKRGDRAIMVLNHGDFHARNIMFKFDDNNKFDDVMFIDFQIPCYAPAIIDITYSLYMLFTEDLRRYHREELIHYYFSIFLETLQKIEFSGELPTLADFYIDLYKYKEFELWVISTFLPMVHTIMGILESKAETKATEDLVSSNDAMSLMYLTPSFIDEVKWLLPRCLYKGYLG